MESVIMVLVASSMHTGHSSIGGHPVMKLLKKEKV